jgi:PD-(D/E)XK endonuclease
MHPINYQSQKVKYMGFFRPTPKEKSVKGAIGAESEAVIAAALIQAGYTVLTPNGYMHRYDLVIEDANGKFWKIQCKTAWLTSGGETIDFSTASLLQAGQRGRKVSTRKTYKDDVHYFAVYSPDTRKVYLIPIEDTPNTIMRLRLTDTSKNGQAKKIKYAADYEL